MRFLLATDGSEHASAAVTALAQFPAAPTASVLVVSVAALPATVVESVSVGSALDEAARRAADEARTALRARWSEVEARVLQGDPAGEILRVAREWRADLVVVGARGLGAMARFFLGSVSTSVLHQAACPVLVVKGRPGAIACAVVAVDGSADSLAAASFLAALPLPPTFQARLLAVIEPLRLLPVSAPEIGAAPLGSFVDDVLREQQTHLEGVLSRAARQFDGRVASLERSVVFGQPADEIAEAVRQANADLVVMGARGLGAVRRLVLGSVSDTVLRRVDCAVLIVKGAATEATDA